MNSLLLAAALAGPVAAETAPLARRISLQEAYDLSLKKSEQVALKEEAVAEALARTDELFSAVKPSLQVQATELFQDKASASPGFSSINQRDRTDGKMMLHQPLFAGFREFLAFKAAAARGKATRLDENRAESLLYQDVASTYLNLLGFQKEIETRLGTVALTADRVRELKNWQRLGRSRKSEVLAAESQQAQLEATLASARGQEQVAQEALRFLTGLELNLKPEDVPVPSTETVDAFLWRVLSRHDVEARKRDIESLELLAKASRHVHWPTISLDGNYYLARSGFQTGVDWDLTFTGVLPLYSGGAVTAQVSQADSRLRQARLAFDLALRQAQRDVRSAHRSLSSSLESARALEKAVALAGANAKAQAEDYRHGVVTNLDVLASDLSLQDARLRFDQSKLDAALARIRLEVAAGGGRRTQ